MRDLNLAGLKGAITSRIVIFANKILNSGANNFLRVIGTLPSVPTGGPIGVRFAITSAGSAAQTQTAFNVSLGAGYTGSSLTVGATISNSAASTGVTESSFLCNTSLNIATIGATAGVNVGAFFRAFSSTLRNYGSISLANESGGIVTDAVGHLGFTYVGGVTNGVGLVAAIRTGAVVFPAYVSTAFLADNMNTGLPIIIARENGSPVFTVDTLGNIKLSRTITAAGTTGAQTINKPAGTIRIAAAGTTVVLTNSLITATSIILALLQTADGTAKSVVAVPAAGSCTFTLNAAATAEVAIGWLVTN